MWRALFLAVGFFVMLVGIESPGRRDGHFADDHDDPPVSNSLFSDGSEPTLGPANSLRPRPGPLGACFPPARWFALLVHHPQAGGGGVKQCSTAALGCGTVSHGRWRLCHTRRMIRPGRQ